MKSFEDLAVASDFKEKQKLFEEITYLGKLKRKPIFKN
jgi:hypothetical protein